MLAPSDLDLGLVMTADKRREFTSVGMFSPTSSSEPGLALTELRCRPKDGLRGNTVAYISTPRMGSAAYPERGVLF